MIGRLQGRPLRARMPASAAARLRPLIGPDLRWSGGSRLSPAPKEAEACLLRACCRRSAGGSQRCRRRPFSTAAVTTPAGAPRAKAAPRRANAVPAKPVIRRRRGSNEASTSTCSASGAASAAAPTERRLALERRLRRLWTTICRILNAAFMMGGADVHDQRNPGRSIPCRALCSPTGGLPCLCSELSSLDEQQHQRIGGDHNCDHNGGRKSVIVHRCLRRFRPASRPPCPPVRIEGDLQLALSGADRALGRLDGAVLTLPDPHVFVFIFMQK